MSKRIDGMWQHSLYSLTPEVAKLTLLPECNVPTYRFDIILRKFLENLDVHDDGAVLITDDLSKVLKYEGGTFVNLHFIQERFETLFK